MDLLKRNLAPILPEAWKAIDEEARRVLKLNLAGRKVERRRRTDEPGKCAAGGRTAWRPPAFPSCWQPCPQPKVLSRQPYVPIPAAEAPEA